MRVVGLHTVHPEHRYTQGEITEAVARFCRIEGEDRRVLDRLHAAMGVSTRHITRSMVDFGGFDVMVEEFRRVAVPLCEQALDTALRTAGLRSRDVDLLMTTSAVGVATPPVDVAVIERMGLRPDVRRMPSFGLGCAGGGVGLSRLHEYLTARPGEVAVLLAVELGSLTLQREDTSTDSFVASGLFGDGVSDRLLPRLIRGDVVDDVVAFLAGQGLSPSDVTAWICHPGGPAILRGVEEGLDLPRDALDVSWRSLDEVGNLSSASVLHILERTLADHAPARGTPGLLLAVGPGVCAELVLLNW